MKTTSPCPALRRDTRPTPRTPFSRKEVFAALFLFAGAALYADNGASPELAHVIEVTSEGHRSGEYTVQDAFNELPESGGTVRLGPGEFELDRAATPAGVPVRITGAGPEETTVTGHIALILNPAPHAEVTELSFTGLYRGVVLSEEGGYGHVKFHRVHFRDISHASIHGGVPGPIERLTITGCRFENVNSGANFRNAKSSHMKVSDNKFFNTRTRPLVLGSGGGENRYAEITNNLIDGVGPGRHPIGILSYVDDTLIEGNTLKNIHNDGRHEAISSRGSNTVIRNNTMIDAGGHTAAISLASNGPTLIENNIIRFTEEHPGQRDGMDLRQRKVRVIGNLITGSRIAISARRGVEGMVIENNTIGESAWQTVAISCSINTGGYIPREGMSGLTIRNNEIFGIAKGEDEGLFHGIRFDIRGHRGEHEPRIDDVLITGNTFRDIQVADGVTGISFRHLPGPMRNWEIVENDFGEMADPVSERIQTFE